MNTLELQNYLIKLGLSSETSEIYLDLLEYGEGTPLSISRRTGINRTKVYRTIEHMQREKLVIQGVGAHTTTISPAPVERIEELLKQQQAHVAELSQNFNSVTSQLAQIGLSRQAETKVKYYKGKSGIQQMVWNVLSTESEIVGYTFRDLTDFVGEKFMADFVQEFKRRNLRMRDIYSDEYRENVHVDTHWGEKMDSRYLPGKILLIPHQMDIYGSTVSIYSWNAGEVWGTEIHNEKVAKMQKQLFELAWDKALKI